MNKDTSDILAAVAAFSAGDQGSDRPIALATVVRTEGSSYRRPGARMLVGERSRIAGSVSGGCLEADLVRRAAWLTREGAQRLRFETSTDPDETEPRYLGCGGTIDVLLEPLDECDINSPLALLAWIAEQDQEAVLVTVVASELEAIPLGARVAATREATRPGSRGEALIAPAADLFARALRGRRNTEATVAIDGRSIELFIEVVPPKRKLLVAGRHHDVTPLVAMARLLGWDVTVTAGPGAGALGDPHHRIEATPTAALGWARSNPRGAAVVMTHSLALDRELLGALLPAASLGYLGVLGPHERTRALVTELVTTRGLSPDRAASLRSPVGLPLGGDGPEAVALSIVSEIQAHFEARAIGADRETGVAPTPAAARFSGMSECGAVDDCDDVGNPTAGVCAVNELAN